MVPLARAEDVSESRLTQFPVHLLTSPHFIHKLALEHVYIWVQLWVEKKRENSYFDKIITDIWVKPTVTHTQGIN